MARLPDYTALGGTPSGRSGTGVVRVDLSAPAQAMVGLGQTVAAAGNVLYQRDEEQRRKQQSFETQRRFLEFTAAQEQTLTEASQTAQPGAFGFRESYAKTYKDAASEFFKTIPDELKGEYDTRLYQAQDSLSGEALKFERTARAEYYTNTVTDGLTTIENKLYAAPDKFDENLAEGIRFIDSIPDDDVSPIAKEGLRRDWEEKARVAALAGMSPGARQAALGVGSSVDIGTVTEGREGAKAILRAKEGFRDTPYWDVNAQRAGYGSDTVTRPDGTVEKVGPDTRVSREEAELDLDRRLGEFEATVIGQVGQREWGAMTPQAQAGLLSVAYNYGSLPSNVANAVKSGDVDAVAAAVEARAGDNDGVNANRRREEAGIIRGTGTIDARSTGSIDPRFAGMDWSARQKVLDGAQTEINQQNAAAQAEAKAAYTLHKDSLTLGIETGQVVSRQTILDDTDLNDGDKATLLRALDTKMGDTLKTQEAIRQFSQGTLSVDQYSTDGKKTVDNMWKEIGQIVDPTQVQAVSEELVRQTGTVPQALINTMRADLSSRDAAAVARAAQSAQRLSTIDSAALATRDGGADVQRAADDFALYVNRWNMQPEDAARRMIEDNNPEAKRDRKALEPLATEFRKELGGEDVASIFNDSWWASDPAVGFTPQQAATIQLDYMDIAENEFFRANGNAEIAKNRAAEQMKRLYGVTSITGNPTVVKHPPENYWPKTRVQQYGETSIVGDTPSLDYATIQLRDELRTVYPDVDMGKVVLITTPETDAEVKRGEMPGYSVMYIDADGVYQTPFPGGHWRPDVDAARARENPAVQREEAETLRRAQEMDTIIRRDAERQGILRQKQRDTGAFLRGER